METTKKIKEKQRTIKEHIKEKSKKKQRQSKEKRRKSMQIIQPGVATTRKTRKSRNQTNKQKSR